MTDLIHLDDTKRGIFERALPIMSEFHKVIGRELNPGFVAEIHAARVLNLDLCANAYNRGYDAVNANGERYEIKYRSAQNIDLRNFDFDFLVLVEMDDSYQLTGLWLMEVKKVRELSEPRVKYQKSQLTTKKFKTFAEQIQ